MGGLPGRPQRHHLHLPELRRPETELPLPQRLCGFPLACLSSLPASCLCLPPSGKPLSFPKQTLSQQPPSHPTG